MTDISASLRLYTFPAPPDLPKVARSEMNILHVEAEHCPFVIRRAFDVVASRSFVPFTIALRREQRVQHVEMEIVITSEKAGIGLLQDLRRINMVRYARVECPLARDQRNAVPYRKA